MQYGFKRKLVLLSVLILRIQVPVIINFFNFRCAEHTQPNS